MKPLPPARLCRQLAFLLLCLVFASRASAQLVINNWIGTDGDWNVAANWDMGTVPDTVLISPQTYDGARVYIDNGGTARLTVSSYDLQELRIQNGTLILSDGADLQLVTVSGSLPDGPFTYNDIPLYLGDTGTRGTLQIGDGGAPPSTLSGIYEIHTNNVVSSDGGQIIFDHNAASYYFAPLIRHNIDVIHRGPGTTILNSNNIYTGDTLVTGGYLSILSNQALGDDSSSLTLDGGGVRVGTSLNNLRGFAVGSNGGTLDLQTNNVTLAQAITGTGAFTKLGTGTLTLSTAQTVTQAWQISAGTLATGVALTFASGSSLTGAGNLTAAGANLTFESGATFNLSGAITVSTATLSFADAATLGAVTLNTTQSILTGAGDLTVNGLLRFTNEGKIYTTNPGARVTLNGGVEFNSFASTFDNRTVDLASDASHIAGTVNLSNGTVLNLQSGRTWTASGNSTVAGGTFNNAGTVTKSAGTGTSAFTGVFNNSGTVNVDTGTVALTGGGTQTGAFALAAGATLNFAGDHSYSAAASFTGASGSLLTFGAGTHSFAAPLTLPVAARIDTGGTLALGGATTFANLTFNGSNPGATITTGTAITVDGQLSLVNRFATFTGTTPGATLTLNGGFSLANESTAITGLTVGLASDTTHASGTLNLNTGTALTNQSGRTWTATGNNEIAGTGTFTNAGTLIKNGGTGTSTISVGFTNTGALDVRTGTLALTGGGTHSGSAAIAAGATLALAGTQNFGTGFTISGPAGGKLSISDGTTTFASGLDYAGTTELGHGILVLNGASTLGAVSLNGGNNIGQNPALGGSGALTLNGLLTLTNRFSSITTTAPGAALNLNGGLTIAAESTGITDRVVALASNTTHSSGTFNLNGTTVVNNQSGRTWTATGNDTIAGTGTFNNAGIFVKNGGTGTSTIATALNNTGTIEVATGTLALSGALTQHSGTTLTGGTWIVHNGATLNRSTGSNIVTNQATVTLDGATSAFTRFTTALADNQGALTLSGGRALTTAGALANSGTLTVSGAGSALTVSGAYAQTGAGSLILRDGGVFSATGGAAINGGTLAGNGTYSGGFSFGSGGTLAPGESIGLLTFDALTLASGATLDFELGAMGGTRGTDFDAITVSGLLNLTATAMSPLTLSLSSLGFTFDPYATGQWSLITASSIAGFDAGAFTFDVSGLGGAQSDRFTITSDGTTIFANYAAVPEPATVAWLAGLAALGVAGFVRRRIRNAPFPGSPRVAGMSDSRALRSSANHD